MRVSVVDDQMLTREGVMRTLTSAGIEITARVFDKLGITENPNLNKRVAAAIAYLTATASAG